MADVHDQIRDFWDRDAYHDDSASHAISDPLEAAAWQTRAPGLPEAGRRYWTPARHRR